MFATMGDARITTAKFSLKRPLTISAGRARDCGEIVMVAEFAADDGAILFISTD